MDIMMITCVEKLARILISQLNDSPTQIAFGECGERETKIGEQCKYMDKVYNVIGFYSDNNDTTRSLYYNGTNKKTTGAILRDLHDGPFIFVEWTPSKEDKQ